MLYKALLLTAFLCLSTFASAQNIDPHSFANFDQVKVKHIDLDLDVDFDSSTLKGSATLKFERVVPNATILVLDTRDLNITNVTSSKGVNLPYVVGKKDPNLGQALTIEIRRNVNAVTVHYST